MPACVASAMVKVGQPGGGEVVEAGDRDVGGQRAPAAEQCRRSHVAGDDDEPAVGDGRCRWR